MTILKKEKANFFLEHYREMNNARRDTERNRLMVLGFYITLTAGLLSFAFSSSIPIYSDFSIPEWLNFKFLVAIFLFLLGIVVIRYFMIARYWHCEHTEVAKAIHRMFYVGDLNLFKAAKETVEINKKEKWSFFNPRGAEFWMYVFVLLLVSVNGIVMLLSYPLILEFSIVPLPLLFVIILGVGFWWYRRYLKKKEEGFPDKSPFIMTNVDSNNQKEEGKRKPKRRAKQ